MIYHPNKFDEPHARAFLVEYLDQLARRDQLRLFELAVGNDVVASRLVFVLGSELYLYFGGYDPTWRKYSIMTVLLTEMIKWAITNGVRRFNLSAGNDQSKLRWKPNELVFRDAVQISPTLRGRIARRAFMAYEALSHYRLRADIEAAAQPSRAS
jgi:CelD/BcsL family acetyltransferase involved in cellulose biosynthesis